MLISSESSLDSRATSLAISFSFCNDGLVSASLADRSGTLEVAWSLPLARRCCRRRVIAAGQELPQEICHRRWLAAGPAHSKSRLTDLWSVTCKVRADSKPQALLFSSRHLLGLLEWRRIYSHLGRGQMALRFNENFKFNSSLGWDMLNIIKNVAFLWTA